MIRKINYEEFCALKTGDKVLLRNTYAKEDSGHPVYHGEIEGRSSGQVYVKTDAPGWHEHCGLAMYSKDWDECRSFHCANSYTIVKVD